MSWLLLAVFVVLAGLTAGLWRAQVQRQNDQAFAAQAASVGASVTTAVRRMDDLTLAARTLLGSSPAPDQHAVRALVSVDGRRRPLRAASPASATSSSCARSARTSTRPASARTTACPSSASPARAWPTRSSELTVPGLDLCQLTNLLGDTRDSGKFSAFVVTSSHGHEMFEVVAPVYRGGGVPTTREGRRAGATGWIIGLFDAEPILRSSVARQTGIAVSLEREHAAVQENRIPTGAGPAFRTLSATLASSSVARFGTVSSGSVLSRRISVEADGRWTVSVSAAAPSGLSSPGGAGHARPADLARDGPARLRARPGAGPRPRPRAADGRGEDRPAAPPGAARRADRTPEPRADHGPRRADARPRPPRTASRPPRCSSTSTASRASTTPSAIRSATSCCAASRRASPVSCARPTRSAASAATSSSCSSRAARRRSPSASSRSCASRSSSASNRHVDLDHDEHRHRHR